MASTPFMQLYPGDYLADTQHFTTEQHGAYLLILMAMWMHGGSLPNDEKKLARVARLSSRRWKVCKGDILAKLTVENQLITQKRLREELQKSVSKREVRKQCGSLGGQANSLNNKERAQAKALAELKHLPDTIQSKHTLDASAREQSDQGQFLEATWEPDSTDRLFAETMNLTGDEIDTEADKFRDYYSATVGDRSRSRNWSARWRKWIRTAIDNQINSRKVNASGKNQNPAQRRAEPLRSATRKFLEELDAEDDRPSAEPHRRALPPARHG